MTSDIIKITSTVTIAITMITTITIAAVVTSIGSRIIPAIILMSPC